MAIVLVVLVFVLFNYLSPLEGRKMAAKGSASSEDADKFGCLGSLWFAFSNLCWQGKFFGHNNSDSLSKSLLYTDT